MRSILFVILALMLIGGGFVAYQTLQKPIARIIGLGPPPTPQQLERNALSVGGVAAGDAPFSKSFDGEGRLASKFRADKAQPGENGHIHVTGVEGEFYQYLKPDSQQPKGRIQLIRIDGRDGNMEVQQDSSQRMKLGQQQQKGGTSAPKRGRLNDVVMKLYRDLGDRDQELKDGRDHFMLKLITNNVSFDNESFEIATESYVGPDGRVVSGDQVPIHVTGDYLFEGRGLKMRWNDVEGRLDYLEVAHGEKLVVKDPKALPGAGGGSRPARITTAFGDPWWLPGMLASADSRAAALAMTQSRGSSGPRGGGTTRPASKREQEKAERHGPQPPYRATFVDDIHITQGQEGQTERELAWADVMNVKFDLGDKSKPTTNPTASPAPATPETPAAPATAPAGPLAANTPAAPATQPAAGPTTKPLDPDQEPVIVRWTGPLRVVPIEPTDRDAPIGLKPGESILHLLGTRAPVVLTRDSYTVRCASADYYSGDGSAALRNSPQFPLVEMKQAPALALPPGAETVAGHVQPQRNASSGAGAGQDTTIIAESMLYNGADRIVVLPGRGQATFGLKNPVAAPDAAVAVTAGGSEGNAPQQMTARWTGSARLNFSPGSKDTREGMLLEHATLLGDVDIKHPQLALKSQTLDMLFDPPAPRQPADTTGQVNPAGSQDKDKQDNQPELKKLIATDDVWCDLVDTNGKKQNLQADRLDLETAVDPDGKRYPRLVNADGHARARTLDAQQQDLSAGHIALTLIPKPKLSNPATQPSANAATSTTRPAAPGGIDSGDVELETLIARDDVRAVSADGAIATCAEMTVVMKDGQPHVKLIGGPTASVVDPKKNVVTGPLITFDSEQGLANVFGPGTMVLMRQDDPDAPPRPVFVAWRDGAELNAPANFVHVRGAVEVATFDADGRTNTARGDLTTIELFDRPASSVAAGVGAGATQPSTRPVKSRDGAPDNMKMDLMKDKDVRAIVLTRQQSPLAEVHSTQLAPDGAVLREFLLRSSVIRYEMLDSLASASPPPTTAPATTQPARRPGRLVVPGPGTLLVRDHRPPEPKEKKPAAAANDGALDTSNSRGAMAFQWTRYMVYDEALRSALMFGDVYATYRSDDPKEPPAVLQADRVDTWFEPKAAAATAVAVAPGGGNPATKPANAGGDSIPALQLKQFRATGHASVTRAGSQLLAERIDYYASNAWLAATGTDRVPAKFVDPGGARNGSAEVVWWNTQTWNVRMQNVGSRGSSNEAAKPADKPSPKPAARPTGRGR